MFRGPNMLLCATIALLVISFSARSQPDPYSANAIMPGCRQFLSDGNMQLHLQGQCVGVVGTILYLARSLQPGIRVCTASGVTVEQIMRVAVKFIDARPNRMHEDFRELTLEAMREAWPCK